MNYNPDDFLSLIAEVESQGGAHLGAEVCKPTGFRLAQPVDIRRPTGAKKNVRVTTTGCGRAAKFLVSMLPEEYFEQGRHLAGSVLEPDGRERPIRPEDFDFDDNESPMATMEDGTPAFATVCAVDDAMGLWPRFSDSMHTGESFQEH